MMHEVASHGGGMTSSSTVHINLFGPHPIVVKGTHEQKARWVPRLIAGQDQVAFGRSEEHTSELQSLMRISYAVFCLKKKTPLPDTLHITQLTTKITQQNKTKTSHVVLHR